jgi:hypothetical protein
MNYVKRLKRLQMKIGFKIFICVKITNIKILIILLVVTVDTIIFKNNIFYCVPEPISSGTR